ncbi:MAG TPA: hypothetical protein DCK98_07025 [Chloroflexi bacterium]|nr:hypothetical protein [Chloroflexota bacterium]HAL27559.1 hypothetical protein [Chloroflexota bacterium]
MTRDQATVQNLGLTRQRSTTPVPTSDSAESRVRRGEASEDSQCAAESTEIGVSVIDPDLIREVSFTPEEAEVKMVLTTPFCPYGPMLTNQIRSVSEQAAEMPVKVTVLPDKWEAPPGLR